ncbi:MAG: cadherin-like domain-containing protein, partial [Chloroflexi bacterium]|nr:cadherin-like domain-containing protein [Chloroflexota bacterium]
QNNRTFDYNNQLPIPSFNNTGMFKKTVGTSITTIDVIFNNTGTLDAQSGTINLTRGGGASDGNFNAASIAAIQFAGGAHTLNAGATITGAGPTNVSSGTLTIDAAATGAGAIPAANFGVTGGTLTGAGELTVSNALTWTGGTMSGSGRTTVEATAALTISGSSAKTLNERTLDSLGAATWTGTASISSGQGAIFNNGGTFDAQNNRTFDYNNQLPIPSFNNTGMFKKTVGTSITTIDVIFNNTGILDAQSGTINLTRSGGVSDGNFNAASIAAIQFAGGAHTLNAFATITGAGPTNVSSGTLAIGAAATGASAIPAANFGVTGGTLTGAGELTVSNALTWTGGTMSGSGKTIIEATAALNMSGTTKNLNERTLDNLGSATWTGTGHINARDGSEFNNIGTFDAQNDRTFDWISGAVPVFNNSGTFTKTVGTSITTIDVIFNNTGTLDAQSGTINLTRGGGVSTGNFTASATKAVQFAGGTHTLNAGATITGDGPTNVSSGTLVIDAGASGGSAIVATNFGITGSSGTLSGAGDITVSGTLTWTAGTMSGSGKTTIEATAALNMSGTTKNLNERTLDNLGTATWTGTGNINARDGSVFNNIGTFDAQNDRTFDWISGAAPVFNNTGTFKKTVGTSITTIDVIFNNTGTLDAQSGTINLTRGGGVSTGNFTASATKAIQFKSGTHTLGVGASITGSGATKIAGGTLVIEPAATIAAANFGITSGTLSGAGDLNVSGTFTWTFGTMNGAGTTAILGSGTMILSGSTKELIQRTLSNAGTVTWTAGQINTRDDALIVNTGTWDVQTDRDLLHITGTKPTFDNDGLFTKTAGTGDTLVSVTFDNAGGTITNTSATGTLTFTNCTGSGCPAGGTLSVPAAGTSATAANVAPATADDAYGVGAGGALAVDAASGVLANDSDPEGDALTAVLVAGPASGTLTLNADGSFSYTHDGSATTTSDSFTYVANDGALDSEVATVAISVTPPPNVAPAAADDAYAVSAGETLVIDAASGVLANDSDPEGDALTAVLVAGPASGTLTLNADGSFSYTHDGGATASDSFTYVANDGDSDSNVATVTIEILP